MKEETKHFYCGSAYCGDGFVLNVTCYSRLCPCPNRLFPTASFALSALSPNVSARPWQWTAYQARTNHIWLLSVTVNYTPHGSCPDAAVEWKRSLRTAATRIFWRWAQSQLAFATALILSVICHFISIKNRFSSFNAGLTGRSVSFERKWERKKKHVRMSKASYSMYSHP